MPFTIPPEVLVHNLVVGVVQLLLQSIIRTYLSAKVYPLTMLKAVWAICAVAVWAWPLCLANLQTPGQLFLFQTFVVLFTANSPLSPHRCVARCLPPLICNSLWEKMLAPYAGLATPVYSRLCT